MKCVYMTSSPTGPYRSSKPNDFEGFDPANGLVEELKKDWKENGSCILICASPDAYDINDEMGRYFADVLLKTGLSFSGFVLCDHRNYLEEKDKISSYDFILLGGGHVPTQNHFFQEMNLKESLEDYDGIIMGISAGSMNCAREVYAQPEEPGEATDPSYQKFFPGLALSEKKVLPHYQAVKNDRVDGLRLFEDITYADSFGHEFYVLVDGSYILKRGEEESIHGEAYLFKNGIMKPIK